MTLDNLNQPLGSANSEKSIQKIHSIVAVKHDDPGDDSSDDSCEDSQLRIVVESPV
jgi:hypothetical protein